jgi:integrase/recombinase XerD
LAQVFVTNVKQLLLSLHKYVRHSYATHLLNNGAPLDVIQSLLGHEKSETTRIYGQLSGKLIQEFYRKYF